MTVVLLLLALLSAETPTAAKVNRLVKVDGKTYRVETRGDVVKVFDKSVLTTRNPEAGRRLRAAVTQATGCRMKDEYWEGAHLAGLLECPMLDGAASSPVQ